MQPEATHLPAEGQTAEDVWPSVGLLLASIDDRKIMWPADPWL